MQFNITFKTIFEYILKKVVLCIQIRFVSTKKTTRISPRVHLVLYKCKTEGMFCITRACMETEVFHVN